MGEAFLHQLRFVYMRCDGDVAITDDEQQAQLGSWDDGDDLSQRSHLRCSRLLPFSGDGQVGLCWDPSELLVQ